MWVTLAVASALFLGVYDIFKKVSLRDNNVLAVLFLNTLFSAVLMSPVVIHGLFDRTLDFDTTAHLLIMLKAVIVLGSWILGYFGIKHLPLTIAGPVNASRPVLVLIGALIIYSEHLNVIQWIGILIGFLSLFLISQVGRREGFALTQSKWLWFSFGAALLGAVSALYDKFLLRSFSPLSVQGWYAFYQFIFMGSLLFLLNRIQASRVLFRWRWSILFISVFLTTADIAYFYALSLPDSMISIVSMIRRGSVMVSFFYGVLILHEKHVRAKIVDLLILLVSLILLVVGSE
ncbi:MAG: EamA family transporter [Bacteroides sp.]|nr:EamA family transporter [Bacteroides sp.]